MEENGLRNLKIVIALGVFLALSAAAYFFSAHHETPDTQAPITQANEPKLATEPVPEAIQAPTAPTDAPATTASAPAEKKPVRAKKQWQPPTTAVSVPRSEVPPVSKNSPKRTEATPEITSEPEQNQSLASDLTPTDREQASTEDTSEPGIYRTAEDHAMYPEFWVWMGSGTNYQYYQQTIPSIAGESSFQNIKSPTLYVRTGFQGDHFGLDLAYKNTPGEIKSSETVSVQNGNYQWQTFSAEGLYRLSDRPWNFRFGLQHHQMPFMVLDPVASTIDLKTNSLALLTLGFDHTHKLSEKLRFEWMVRYQHPLLSGSSSGAEFKIDPKFAFDGSVGSVYQVGPNFRAGAYWYGQWHQYGFNYKDGTNSFSGNQVLFYSNLELRLGFEF